MATSNKPAQKEGGLGDQFNKKKEEVTKQLHPTAADQNKGGITDILPGHNKEGNACGHKKEGDTDCGQKKEGVMDKIFKGQEPPEKKEGLIDKIKGQEPPQKKEGLIEKITDKLPGQTKK